MDQKREKDQGQASEKQTLSVFGVVRRLVQCFCGTYEVFFERDRSHMRKRASEPR